MISLSLTRTQLYLINSLFLWLALCFSVRKRLKKQMEMLASKNEQLKKRDQDMTEEYKHNIQQFERLKKKTK